MKSSKDQALVKFYSKYMMVVGVLGNLLFYFQAYTIFSTKCAFSVSTYGFSIAFFSVSSWLIYGLLMKDKVLVISNAVAVLGSILVLAGIIIHK